MLIPLAVFLSGVSAATAVLLFSGPLRRGAKAPRVEPAMPWWWRCAWPWAAGLSPLAGTMLPWRARERGKLALERAGLPPSIGPQDFVALTVVAGLSGAATIALCSLWLDVPAAVPAVLAGCAGIAWPRLWLRRLAAQRQRRIARDLPFVLDLMTLCVEAGLGLHSALLQSAQCSARGPLRDMLDGALADMRTGMSRTAALKSMAARSGSMALQAWASVMAQADALGMSLGPLMRGQAAQCRADRFQRAERLAMEAPVKMLLPLIGCIFPCTFIVLGFPIAWQLLPALQ